MSAPSGQWIKGSQCRTCGGIQGHWPPCVPDPSTLGSDYCATPECGRLLDEPNRSQYCPSCQIMHLQERD